MQYKLYVKHTSTTSYYEATYFEIRIFISSFHIHSPTRLNEMYPVVKSEAHLAINDGAVRILIAGKGTVGGMVASLA